MVRVEMGLAFVDLGIKITITYSIYVQSKLIKVKYM